MSIVSEIEKLKTNITNSYLAVENKGGIIPTNKNTDNLTESINSISSGIDIQNGSLYNNYYTYSGTIKAGNFVNVQNITDWTDLDGTYGVVLDGCYINSNTYVLLTIDNNKQSYLCIYKDGEFVNSISLIKSSSSFITVNNGGRIICSNGVNIAIAIKNGYGATVITAKYDNSTSTITIIDNISETPSTLNESGLRNVTFLKETTEYIYYVLCLYVSANLLYIIKVNKETGSITDSSSDSYVLSGASSSYSSIYGGVVNLTDTTMLCVYDIPNSSGYYTNKYYILTYDDVTISAKKEYSLGLTIRKPSLFKLGNLILLFNNYENILYCTLFYYDGSLIKTITISENITLSETYTFKFCSINDSNGIIAFNNTYNSNNILTYIPFKIENNNITFGTPVATDIVGTYLTSVVNFLENNILLYRGSGSSYYDNSTLYIIGTLSDLEFVVGKKYVTLSTTSIDGVTKTDCSETTPGDVYLLQ